MRLTVPCASSFVLALVLVQAAAAEEPFRLVPADGAEEDHFGAVVDLDGQTLVVGAPRSDGVGLDQGAAYVWVSSGDGWALEAKLTAFDGAAGDAFGAAVAIDGDTLAVGALADDDTAPSAGSVYVFTRSGSTWSVQAKLVHATASRLGQSVALRGDRLVAGAPTSSGGGRALVFARSGSVWSLEATLVANDAQVGDLFGAGVALDGDRVAVGASAEDTFGIGSGSVYLFTRSDTSWAQEARLLPTGLASAGAAFGSTVALQGDIVVGGGPVGGGAIHPTGAAWIFERSPSGWTRTAILRPDEPGAVSRFGTTVDIDEGVVVVGAPEYRFGDNFQLIPGLAYAFRREDGVWRRTRLVAADVRDHDDFGAAIALDGGRVAVGAPQRGTEAAGPGSAYVGVLPSEPEPLPAPHDLEITVPDQFPGDRFGTSLATNGERLVVGAPFYFGDDRGGVYVFESSGSAWTPAAILWPEDAGPGGEQMGSAVTVQGNTIVAGAHADNNANGTSAGAAFVFEHDDAGWTQRAKLVAFGPGAQTGDRFGSSIDLDGDTLAVGAVMGGPLTNVGSVYVFQRSGTDWLPQEILTASDGLTRQFGLALDVCGDTLVAGAAVQGPPGDERGAVYVYTRTGSTWGNEVRLTAGDSQDGDRFGAAVALEGDTLLVGAPLAGGAGISSGAVYAFTRSGTTWVEGHRIRPRGPDFTPHAEGRFGERLALRGDRLAVSAWRHGGDRRLYAFARSGTHWVESGRFVAADTGLVSNGLGHVPLALDDSTLFAGYPFDDGVTTDAGALYLFCPLLAPFTPFCAAVPNSSGAPASIAATGTNSVAKNDLALVVTGMPPGASALVLYSPDQAATPLGDGILCLGNGTQGFVNRLAPGASDDAGTFVHAPDLTAPPAPESAILPGSVWSFSCWFRDPAAGGAGFNFSDGVQVAFGP